MRQFIAILKILSFFLVALVLSLPQIIILLFHKGKFSYILPQLTHRLICFIFRIKVRVEGQISAQNQTIFLSNHISYLDIPVIGTFVRASFVAKKDVKGWPLIGQLSQLQQTGFISRESKDALIERDSLSGMIERNKSLIIFPEGTSTEGISVYPFKSSLFASFLDRSNEDLLIQPFVIYVESINGKSPKSQEERDIYAWHINMETEMPAHLWRFAKSKGATIKLKFCPTILVKDFTDRKTLAKLCHETVSKELEKQIQNKGN